MLMEVQFDVKYELNSVVYQWSAVLLSSRKVLVLEDQFTSPCTCPCPRTTESSKLVRTSYSTNSPLCMISWSINLVTATVHEVTVKNALLTDIRYYLLIYIRKVLVLEDQFISLCPCPYPRTTSPCPRATVLDIITGYQCVNLHSVLLFARTQHVSVVGKWILQICADIQIF